MKKGAFLSSGFHGASLIIDILVMVVMARLLMPSDYGLFAAAFIFIAFCDLIREIGIGASVIQLPTLSVEDQRTASTLAVLTGLLSFAVIQVGAPFFAAFVNLPELELILRVLAISIIIQSFAVVPQGLLLRQLKVTQVAKAEFVARTVSSCVIGVGLALYGWRHWALILASVSDVVIRSLILIFLAKPNLRPCLNRTAARRLMRVGSGFAASRYVAFISQQASTAIIARFADVVSLGLFSRAAKLMMLPTVLYRKVADRAVFPAMAKVQDQPERLRNAYLRGLELTALIGLPLCLSLFMLAPQLIRVLMGEKWLGVIPIFAIMAIGTYFTLAAGVSGSVLRAKASMKRYLLSQVLFAAVSVVGSLIAVKHSILAVAWVVVLANLILFFAVTIFASSLTGVTVRSYLATQRSGVLLAIVVCATIAAVNSGIGLLTQNALLVLLTHGAAFMGLAFVLMVLRPRILLGTEGTLIAGQLLQLLRNLGRGELRWGRK